MLIDCRRDGWFSISDDDGIGGIAEFGANGDYMLEEQIVSGLDSLEFALVQQVCQGNDWIGGEICGTEQQNRDIEVSQLKSRVVR